MVTARASNFPASLRKLQLDVLEEVLATAFLLDRTRDDRVRSADDFAQAREIARELGGLALGLEQAGAYIATGTSALRAISNCGVRAESK